MEEMYTSSAVSTTGASAAGPPPPWAWACAWKRRCIRSISGRVGRRKGSTKNLRARIGVGGARLCGRRCGSPT